MSLSDCLGHDSIGGLGTIKDNLRLWEEGLCEEEEDEGRGGSRSWGAVGRRGECDW